MTRTGFKFMTVFVRRNILGKHRKTLEELHTRSGRSWALRCKIPYLEREMELGEVLCFDCRKPIRPGNEYHSHPTRSGLALILCPEHYKVNG